MHICKLLNCKHSIPSTTGSGVDCSLLIKKDITRFFDRVDNPDFDDIFGSSYMKHCSNFKKANLLYKLLYK